MEFIRQKFSDEKTKQRYNAKPPTPDKNPNDQWATFAWRTVRYLTKIEEGIDRLAIAGLIDKDAYRGLADSFSSVFTFDQRLRIVERLLRKKRLEIVDPSRKYKLPIRTGDDADAITAIRTAMRYRNMLFHNGVFSYIAGNDVGFAESLWVEVPEGSQHPSVPLIYRAGGQPGLLDLAGELALGLPFYFGNPIIQVCNEVDVNCSDELTRAWSASRKSHHADQERMKKRFDSLVKKLCK